MTRTTAIDFAIPSDFSPDPLTDVLRAGARELLATAVRDRGASPYLSSTGKKCHTSPPARPPAKGSRTGWVSCE